MGEADRHGQRLPGIHRSRAAPFRTGRAVLVAMPPQEEAYRGADVLNKQQPLSGPLDKHTVIYRFVVPVGKMNP